MEIYGFRVGERIPTVAVPLLDNDQIVVDFGAIYQHTFESFRWFSDRLDYAQAPADMGGYLDEDQARIRAVMATVQTE